MAMRGAGGISRWRNRRRLFLMIFGFAYVVVGFSYLLDPSPQPTQAVAVQLAPLPVWGAVWCAFAVAMVWSAVRHWQDQGGGDLGFALAVTLPVLWGVLAFVSWLAADASRGWVTAVVYWTIAAAVMSAAGMVDPRFGEQAR